MKPLIGICANYLSNDAAGMAAGIGAKNQEWQMLADDYIVAIERAGGVPVILPITEDIETLTPLLQKIDGILFSGGSDIDPNYYGEYPKFGLGFIEPKRDAHEIKLAQKVLFEMNVPVLGICRGMQLLTVATGGTLYQDLQSQKPAGINHSVPKALRHHAFHPVEIEKDSILYQIYETTELGVNSFHHQAVKDIGQGFKATMLAPDGIVEGMELQNGDRFVVAVQWHPEMMEAQVSTIRPLFNAFVEKCKLASHNLTLVSSDETIA
ncbi:gamma-glutamyl-gamma-aminobutyrate hydrolase family protein [Psychrobacillus sp. NEAU-3TGS]|uniref:gamma-glutamyl-gamma-aminobutyrate hydrolase family protein n=1 Tax=Psychrobacillus sp. NEAU-3TGS TaxID=2995412 RepID=UPI0024963C0B|nr:gamma-glutamyl-gamma-aminobutyrate hydrolase family protein [Psychrobacillus sp. NEAU-3TGS]MDI2587479.1 gamma-glutamyl-gamma-aminobutyrate hydrolase family protein [Psychrobacillus sp. NEAU-3TGS]